MMGRIRSFHPGFFTDEAMVDLSPQAQIFLVGLWTESDDQGVFEWKPSRLKMRLLPVSNVDVGALLEQLVAADAIRKATIGGVQVGLVRNFAKYQRPRRPKFTFVVPPECRQYLGLDRPSADFNQAEAPPDDTREPDDGHPVSQMSGITTAQDEPVSQMSGMPPQMEEEGGRREEGEKEEGDSFDGASAPKSKRRAKLPADWQPTPEQLAYARAQGCADPADTAERFRLHHQSKGTVGADWNLGFQYWCRNEKNFRRSPDPPAKPGVKFN